MLEKNCPTCKKKTVYGQHPHFPFCSARCRDSDFLGWTKEENIIQTPLIDADSTTEFGIEEDDDF